MTGASAGRLHVFAGPSLTRAEVLEIAPTALVYPPVAHGDLLRVPAARHDTVVVIDGMFQQAASVRHKEILDLLGSGVRVVGAASMGALRAAELGPFGMTGHGIVHRLYSIGLLEADDEVALLHDDSDDWTARTVAKVSVRMLARRLRRRGQLTAADEQTLIAAASALPFTARSWTALLAGARDSGMPAATTDRIRRLVRAPARHWDIKAQDAIGALRAADRPGPPRSEPPDWPVTGYLVRWRHPPDSAMSMLVTAAQLYAEDYPALHFRAILAAIAAESQPIPANLPLPALEEAAVAAARGRGLIPASETVAPAAPWLAPGERYPDPTRRWSRILVRSYRWAPNHPPLPLLHDAVLATTGITGLRRIVAAADQLNSQLHRRGYSTHAVSQSAVRKICQRYWRSDTLTPAMYDHGFIDTHDLYRRARPLTTLGLLKPPAPIRLLDP